MQIGPYNVVRELARGGMGVVYVARQVGADREVALKLMLGEQVTDVARQRFATEAQALARLNHPGIVSVHEFGLHQGNPYLAMELIDGEALDDVLKREGALDPKRVAQIGVEMAEAMAYAHRAQILHRDLKPANVLLTRDGRAVITDFGLARDPSEEKERLTRTGVMLGTPAYMPPEQADGDKHAIGPAADVYSLGATLYALVKGEAPFSGESALNIVTKVLKDEPAPLGVDPPFDAVVLKCMEKEVGRRYRRADNLAEDLRRYLAGEAVRAGPSAGQRQRKKRIVLGLVGVLILGAVAAGGAFVVRRWAVERQAQLEALRDRARAEGIPEARRWLAEHSGLATDAQRAEVEERLAAWVAAEAEERERAWTALEPLAGAEALSAVEAWLARYGPLAPESERGRGRELEGELARRRDAALEACAAVRVASDEDRYWEARRWQQTYAVDGSPADRVFIRSVLDTREFKQPLKVFRMAGEEPSGMFLADGSTLLWPEEPRTQPGETSALSLWRDGERVARWDLPEGSWVSGARMVERDLLVVVEGQATFEVRRYAAFDPKAFDLDEPSARSEPVTNFAGALEVSPDGRWLAVGAVSHTERFFEEILYVYDLADGKVALARTIGGGLTASRERDVDNQIRGLGFSPDSKHLFGVGGSAQGGDIVPGRSWVWPMPGTGGEDQVLRIPNVGESVLCLEHEGASYLLVGTNWQGLFVYGWDGASRSDRPLNTVSSEEMHREFQGVTTSASLRNLLVVGRWLYAVTVLARGDLRCGAISRWPLAEVLRPDHRVPYQGGHHPEVTRKLRRVEVSPDGELFLIGEDERSVQLWVVPSD